MKTRCNRRKLYRLGKIVLSVPFPSKILMIWSDHTGRQSNDEMNFLISLQMLSNTKFIVSPLTNSRHMFQTTTTNTVIQVFRGVRSNPNREPLSNLFCRTRINEFGQRAALFHRMRNICTSSQIFPMTVYESKN